MAPFTNKVILITGAGSGLGRELAVTLAGQGAAIAAIDLHPEPLLELASALPGRSVAWAVADVALREELHKACAHLVDKLGPVDVLIANAGIGVENSAFAFRAADFEAQVRVNLLGVAYSVEAVLPGMLARRAGHIVGISSLASFRGIPRMLGYCASKSGLNAFLEGLRAELRPRQVDVSIICPGWIRTGLTSHLDLAREDLMELPYAAGRIARAIRRRRPFYAFPPGTAWRLRLMRWLPSAASDWLIRRALGRVVWR